MGPGTFERPRAVQRLVDLDEAGQPIDLLVVGGGITGAGVALDAASRGLHTVLVERADFASGTSSRSSKLVHGGLRYLQQGDIRLVYEALAERQRLRHNAPHLVHVLPFLLPVFTRDGLFNRKIAWALGKAMWMYDLTGGARIGKLHKKLSADDAVAQMPTLPRDRLAGAYLYYDATTDDARLALAVARTAALDHGAVVLNRAEVVGWHHEDARLAGARVLVRGSHGEGDRELLVRARQVVSATGVWSDALRGLGPEPEPETIRPAKGVHITVPWDLVRNEVAVVVPVPGDRRSVFVVPWGDHTYVGTTDTDYTGSLDEPRCTAEDVDYLLRALNASVETTITTDDITGMWAGLRPLVRSTGSGRTADLSRRHRVTVDDDGLVSINGGKLTTYREMAEDTVDEVMRHAGDSISSRTSSRSRTKSLRLRGADGLDEMRDLADDAAAESEAAPPLLEHLVERYGGEARVLTAMIDADPSLGAPIAPGHRYVAAEVAYAVRHEMATSLDDVLTRRVPLRLRDARASMEVAEAVAALMADDLAWDEAACRAEVEAYRAEVADDLAAAGLDQAATPATQAP